MKNVVVALSLLLVSTAIFAQTATTTTPQVQKKAEDYIKFKEATHNFGKIKQGVPVTVDFYFTNNSEQPIVIEYASASCGCTTPTWPQGAIAKGKTDKITAGFNAGAVAPFNKAITVKLAGIDIPVVLTITGEVLTPEEYAKYEASKEKATTAKPGSK
jgi:hypothetical protein